MKYGIFEIGYTTVCIYDSKEIAINICNELNTKIIRRKSKGEIKETIKKVNKYYVKEVKNTFLAERN